MHSVTQLVLSLSLAFANFLYYSICHQPANSV
jgi:hypothetical protein